MALLALVCSGCATGDFEVVHHRSNGCDPEAQENSLRALRCVRDACAAGTAPCALEGDARVLRVRGGSLGDDLEAVWIHDGSTARTAWCPDGDLDLPGDRPIDAETFASCRLRDVDGSVSEEPIPTLEAVLAALEGSEVRLYLELKTVGDVQLDSRLTDGAVDTVRGSGFEQQTVVATFDRAALARAKRAGMTTACFTPSGSIGRQFLAQIRGAVASDVDACADDGHDYVFVAAGQLDGTVASHARHAGVGLGVFAADSADGHDAVMRWSHAVDVVHTDIPLAFASR